MDRAGTLISRAEQKDLRILWETREFVLCADPLLGGIELALARYPMIQDLQKDLAAGWFEHLCICIIVVAS
jgi:acetone carboxylase gamma subunit